MTVAQLRTYLRRFQDALQAHERLWDSSHNGSYPYSLVRNQPALAEQMVGLNRQLGRLWPFLTALSPTIVPAIWNNAVGDMVHSLKPANMRAVDASIHQISGYLDNFPDAMTIKEIVTPETKPAGKPLLDCIHPVIAAEPARLYREGNYPEAIKSAITAIQAHLRHRIGSSNDGAALVDEAFSTTNRRLVFGDLHEPNVNNVQVGFMEMLKGFLKSTRNVQFHSHGTMAEPQAALEFLMMSSWICRRIDDADKVS